MSGQMGSGRVRTPNLGGMCEAGWVEGLVGARVPLSGYVALGGRSIHHENRDCVEQLARAHISRSPVYLGPYRPRRVLQLVCCHPHGHHVVRVHLVHGHQATLAAGVKAATPLPPSLVLLLCQAGTHCLAPVPADAQWREVGDKERRVGGQAEGRDGLLGHALGSDESAWNGTATDESNPTNMGRHGRLPG